MNVDDSKYWTSLDKKDKCDRFVRLKLIQELSTDKLSYEMLHKYGLKAAPQSKTILNYNSFKRVEFDALKNK